MYNTEYETNTHLYICKVEWYDNIHDMNQITYFLCNANSFDECVKEFYYQVGEDCIISMAMFALEEGPLDISKSVANAIINEEFFEEMEVTRNGTERSSF